MPLDVSLDMPVTPPDGWKTQDGKVEQWPEGWTTGPAIGPNGEPPGDYYNEKEVAVIDPKGVVRGHAFLPGDYLSQRQAWFHTYAREYALKIYQERLDFGVVQEQARKDLPLLFTDCGKEVEQLQVAHDFQKGKHAECSDSLRAIWEALDRADCPTWNSERPLTAAERVDALIGDVVQLRAAVRLEWKPQAASTVLILWIGKLRHDVLTVHTGTCWMVRYLHDGEPYPIPAGTRETILAWVAAHVERMELPCTVPAFPEPK